MTVQILRGDCRDVKGQFLPGVRSSPATEFKAGAHWRTRKPHWDKAWLEHQYIGLQRSAADIARDAGVGETAIDYWLAKHQIARRTIAEARAVKHWGVSGPANPMFGRFGPACPNYIAGTSPERGRLFSRAEGKAFRAAVRERDGHRCRRCNHAERGKWSLPVHHIKPWARHPELRYDVNNGVTLCKPCHLWVHSRKNTKREWLA